MKIVELDTVLSDEDAYSTAQHAGTLITSDYNVAFEVVTESGPAGGHPVIRYAGPEHELQSMIITHYGQDTWDAISS